MNKVRSLVVFVYFIALLLSNLVAHAKRSLINMKIELMMVQGKGDGELYSSLFTEVNDYLGYAFLVCIFLSLVLTVYLMIETDSKLLKVFWMLTLLLSMFFIVDRVAV
jgi:uncharacterized membrane protein